MIELLIRSVILSLVGSLAVLASRKTSPSLRHTIVVATFATILLLPVMRWALPQVSLPVLPSQPVRITYEPVDVTQAVPPTLVPQTAAQAPQSDAIHWEWLFAVGSVLFALRLIGGWCTLAWRLRRAELLNIPSSDRLIVVCGGVPTPMTAWVLRPVIVLPLDWRSWPTERLELVIQHEEAHIRRGDLWSLAITRFACALFWANPFVWLLARFEADFAEQATDNLVVSHGVPAWLYAQELLAIAQGAAATASLPALSMARKAEVARRVEMVLKSDTSRPSVGRWLKATILAATFLVALPIASWALGPQSTPLTPLTPQQAHPTEGNQVPFQIMLKCKVIDSPATKTPVYVVSNSAKLWSDSAKTISAPVIRTLNAQKAVIMVARENAKDEISLTPYAQMTGEFVLDVDMRSQANGKWQEGVKCHVRMKDKEFVTITPRVKKGQKTMRSTIIQLVVVKDNP